MSPTKSISTGLRPGKPQNAPARILCVCALAAVMILFSVQGSGAAGGKPSTVAEIALCQGADREQLLIEGAKKEGQVVFYNINTWLSTVAQEFEKKYPFVKVSVWRSDSKTVLKRVTEEYASGRYLADVIDCTFGGVALLQKMGVFQEYYSPEMAAYADEVKAKGKTGVYYLPDLELYIGLGYNTKLVPAAETPKTFKDVLDPKWKGRISFAGTTTGSQWIGNALNVMGREYLEKLGGQDVKVQNISGAAIAGLIVSGEVPLSPTIYESNILTAKEKGGPVDWRPLEPVVANVGSSGMTTKAPHPHAALLFLDYVHSKEGQRVMMKGGLGSPREDVGSVEKKFKKTYLEAQYSLEDLEKKIAEWEELMKRVFIKRR